MKKIHHIKYTVLLSIIIITSLDSFSQKMVLSSGARIIVSAGTTVINPGDLTINSGAFLELTGNMTVSGTLTNSAGTSGLVITSDASNTGSLIQSTDAVNGTVERYIADNAWHLVTPSTTGVTANDFYWNDAPKSWLTYHTESTNEWTYNTSLATSMPVGQGWAVWLDDASKSDATATMTGALRASDLSVSLSYSGSGVNQGWNLIGNPFASAIDKDEGSWGTNISGTIYVWVNGDNDYRYYATGSGGTLTGGIIPAGQGFFVKSSSEGGFTIPAAARVHSSQAFYKSTEMGERPFVRLDLTVGTNRTVAFVGFPEEGTSEFDVNFDADRLYGSLKTPQMIIPEGERKLCINASSPLIVNEPRIVPLHVMFFIDGEYTLTISDLDQLPDVQITLEDLVTGASHDLSQNNTYQFSANAGDDPGRFLLHFNYNPYGLEEPGASGEEIYIYAYGKNIYVRSTGKALNLYGALEIFDIYGRKIQQQQLDKSELVVVPVDKENNYLIARVIKGNIIKTRKLFIN
ncbi:MAG: hypothetical protein D4R67_03670 [Bacteroidetes bacterium]|nr:MAG: hypothetical protein D4R67_03670 [Bacteroidota bacterium]